MQQQLEQFWQLVIQVWQQGVLGVDIGRLVVAASIILAAIVFRRWFGKAVLVPLKVWASRTRVTYDDVLIADLEGPVALLPVVLGIFLAGEYLRLDGSLLVIWLRVIKSLIAFSIFWGFYNGVHTLAVVFQHLNRVLTPVMVDWLAKIARIGVVFMGGASILGMWGINVGGLLAGLGLFGVAVALGAQDLFKNLIAGILVIAEKRFNPGDWVAVDGVVEGTVERIGFRSTLIRRFDKAPVYVPNAKLSDNAVTNFSAMTHRRIYWTIGVAYHTTVPQLQQIRDGIEHYLLAEEAFERPENVATFVRIDSFGDSSINILLYCFTRTTNWGEWLAVKEKLAYQVKNIIEGAGSSFAFPSRSLYVESWPGVGQPEVFTPPTAAAETE